MSTTLMQGDCLDLLPTLEAGSVDLIITSPPYFNARDYGAPAWLDYPAYLAEMAQWVESMVRTLRRGRMICLVVSPVIVARAQRNARSQRLNIPADLHSIAAAAGLWFQESIIWIKPEGAAINRNQRFSLDRHPLQWRANPVTETILVYQQPTSDLNDAIIRAHGGRDRVMGEYERSDVWYLNPETRQSHPAPFPVGIPERLIQYYSWAGDTVLDPFMGSGTTGVACITTGRDFIGMEQDGGYFQIATQRIAATQPPLLEAIA